MVHEMAMHLGLTAHTEGRNVILRILIGNLRPRRTRGGKGKHRSDERVGIPGSNRGRAASCERGSKQGALPVEGALGWYDMVMTAEILRLGVGKWKMCLAILHERGHLH